MGILHKIAWWPYEPIRRDNMMYEDIVAKMNSELIQHSRPVQDCLHSYTEKDNMMEIWYRFRFSPSYRALYSDCMDCFNQALDEPLKDVCNDATDYHIDYRFKNLGDVLDCVTTIVWNDD